MAATEHRGADVVIEAVGRRDALRVAYSTLRVAADAKL